MAERELWYAQFGPLVYEDTDTGWYPDGKPIRGARTSQVYLDNTPVDDIEVIRLIDLKGHWTNLFLLMGA